MKNIEKTELKNLVIKYKDYDKKEAVSRISQLGYNAGTVRKYSIVKDWYSTLTNSSPPSRMVSPWLEHRR